MCLIVDWIKGQTYQEAMAFFQEQRMGIEKNYCG